MPTLDQRGIIGDWLVKLVLGFVIFGVIAFDAGSIIVNYFTLDSEADRVANQVTLEASRTNAMLTDNDVYLMAKQVVESEEEGVEGAKVLRRGTDIDTDGFVHIRLRRTAKTLVVQRIGAISDWGRATSSGQSRTT